MFSVREKSEEKDTSPDDSLDSKSDMGRIVRKEKRPVPECAGRWSLRGVADPVRM